MHLHSAQRSTMEQKKNRPRLDYGLSISGKWYVKRVRFCNGEVQRNRFVRSHWPSETSSTQHKSQPRNSASHPQIFMNFVAVNRHLVTTVVAALTAVATLATVALTVAVTTAVATTAVASTVTATAEAAATTTGSALSGLVNADLASVKSERGGWSINCLPTPSRRV